MKYGIIFFTLAYSLCWTTAGWAQALEPMKGQGPTVLWHDPGPMEAIDLSVDPGKEQAPVPPFMFQQEDADGTTPKIIVRDANGRIWSVKWGQEAHPEVFATRLVAAMGYLVEPSYFIREGTITGVGKLTRAERYIDRDHNNRFRNARFELRSSDILLLPSSSWSWGKNPFTGTPQLQGLKILMMLVSNWDVKDIRDINAGSNTMVVQYNVPGQQEQRYLVNDWGATMGKWGNFFTREKWDCDGYASQTSHFVKGVKDGRVDWGFTGKRTSDMTQSITAQDVQWIMQYLGRLTDDQLRAGLQSAGASPKETSCFVTALRSRIEQLRRISQST